jgi:hypothetical protein
MHIKMLTVNEKTNAEHGELKCDLFAEGKQKWVLSHVVWAMAHGLSVQISPDPEFAEEDAIRQKKYAAARK